jgi:hypothetical protein
MKVQDVPFLKFLLDEGFTATSTDFPEGHQPWDVYLTSEKFNIVIGQDRGGVLLLLAPPSSNTKNVSTQRFIEVRAYVSYFLNDISYPHSTEFDSTDQQIITLTNLLERYFSKLCAFFDKENYSIRKKEFDAFLKARKEDDMQEYREEMRARKRKSS